jgi:streptogramin lyase
MLRAVRKFHITLSLPVLLLVTSASVSNCRAQSISENSPELTITTVELPKEMSVFALHHQLQPYAIGEGTIWFHNNDRVFKFGPQTNEFTSMSIEHVKAFRGGGFAVGGGSLWSFGKAHGVEGVHRIDPDTGKCLAAIAIKGANFNTLTYGEGALWVFNERGGHIQRVDPKTNQVSAANELGKGMWWTFPVVGEGFFWVLDIQSGTMKRVDLLTAKTVDEFQVGSAQAGFLKSPFSGGFYLYTVGEGSLWVANNREGSNGTYALYRFDSKTHERIARLESDGSGGVPAVWKGFVWLADHGYEHQGHYLKKISLTTNHAVGQVFLPAGHERLQRGSMPPILLAGEHSLWAIGLGDRSLSRIQAKLTESTNP